MKTNLFSSGEPMLPLKGQSILRLRYISSFIETIWESFFSDLEAPGGACVLCVLMYIYVTF